MKYTQLLARFTCAAVLSTALLAPAADAPLKPDDKGFIRDWLLLAPIPLAGENTGVMKSTSSRCPTKPPSSPRPATP